MTTSTKHWVQDLFSDRAKMAGPGMVGIDPKAAANVIAFGGGFPDPQSLPIADIIESTRVALERDGEWALQYAFGSGTFELQDELLQKLKRDQGIVAERQNLLITSGASQGLGLIFQAFVNPGDPILTEAPFFLGVVQSCRKSGADVREIGLDADGLVIEDLEHELDQLRNAGKRAKFLYLVPNFQNPSGITYSLERRKQIIALCEQHHVPIIEDDAYFDLRFEGEKIPTFYELADPGMVMYAGTFSKIIAAGLRLGWIVADPAVIAHLSGLKTDASTNTFSSQIVAEFAGSGTLVEHISQLKEVYHQRRDVMLDALQVSMPATVSWTRPDGGFFIWLTLPEGVTCAEVAPVAMQRGVSVGQGPMFFSHGGGQRNLRLSYSFNSDAEIRRGIEILADVIREQAES